MHRGLIIASIVLIAGCSNTHEPGPRAAAGGLLGGAGGAVVGALAGGGKGALIGGGVGAVGGAVAGALTASGPKKSMYSSGSGSYPSSAR
jgi:hypothetical protein